MRGYHGKCVAGGMGRIFHVDEKAKWYQQYVVSDRKHVQDIPDRREKDFFDAYERFDSKNMDKIYFVFEMKNYVFIGIAPERDQEDTISTAQLNLLKSNIEKAAKLDIPVFVSSHCLLQDTIDTN
jgi:hypothetical protein